MSCHYKYKGKITPLPLKIIKGEPGTQLGKWERGQAAILRHHLPSPALEGWLQSCLSQAGRGDTEGAGGAGCAGIQLLGWEQSGEMHLQSKRVVVTCLPSHCSQPQEDPPRKTEMLTEEGQGIRS